jgi:DNA-binding NarL/FixJ family response regulator
VRVVVADDNALIREGLAALLRESGMDVVGKCADPDELLAAVRAHEPDVAVVDVRMPPTHTDEGLRAAREIRAGHPGTGVLILSQYVEVGLAMTLLAESAEGLGYLLKDRVTDLDEFTDALRRVAAGGSALDPAVVTQLLARERPDDLVDTLTPREREVLELMAAGSSNQGIAEKLQISVGMVEKYASSIFEKLGLPTARTESRRVLAVLAFLRA